jgi:hypothetical protein
MAKKYTIDLEVNRGKADANIEDVLKAIKELNNAVVNGSKKAEDSLEGVEAAAKKSASGVSKLGKILNNLAKAGGVIFLLNKAFDFFKEVASENQKVVDFFSITMEALSIAFNDLFKFIENNVGSVVGYFKAIFNDPLQAVKDLGNAIKDNIIERFNSALEVAGYLGSALKKLFTGDFAGALDDAKSAGAEFVDVLTGVDDSANKIADAVSGVVDATSKYVGETIKAAKATVDLNKQAEIAAVLQQGLVETYDRQAEKLRQVRDEERNTITDRIAANEQLKAVLDEQEAAMLRQVDTIIAAAQAQYNKNANQENYIALLQATQEREAVLAQIEGFRSEQLSNDLALNRESLELTQSQADASAERAISEQQFLAEQIEGEYLKLQALKNAAEQEALIEEERLTNKRNQYNAGTQAFVDANNELLAFQQENAQQQIEIDRDLNLAKQQLVTDALGNLASIVGENSKFGKGIALVQAIRDTYAGANLALASAPPPFNFISAAAVIAGGLANVKSITATPEPKAPSFARGAGGGASVSIPTPQAPSFNVVGASGTNQLAETIAGQSREPMKAYVVSNDVSTAQSLDRNIVEGASI